MFQRKRMRTCSKLADKNDFFDGLPDDLVICILGKLSSSASSPSDFMNALIICRRFNRLGLHPMVLSKAGRKAVAVKAKNWSDSANRFLKRCVSAGNIEASYALGMIRFYCFQDRASGISLMAKAAIRSHAPALYSLAVILFNGSGASKDEKDLRAGFALCGRAASLGHVDALLELGHCLLDGYGVGQDIEKGRRLLIEANVREFMIFMSEKLTSQLRDNYYLGSGPDVQDKIRYNAGVQKVHPVNKFLKEWFEARKGGLLDHGLRLCSHDGCGRPETRAREFRRCSVCSKVNYCSRGCQANDWKVRHKIECVPLDPLINHGNGGDGVAGVVEIEPAENVGAINDRD